MTPSLAVVVTMNLVSVVANVIVTARSLRHAQRADAELAIALRHTDELRRIIARYGLVELELVQDADGTHYRAHVNAAPLPRRERH